MPINKHHLLTVLQTSQNSVASLMDLPGYSISHKTGMTKKTGRKYSACN